MTNPKIQLRRGTAADLPDASIEGEPRFATDTGALYIDDGTNNILIGGTADSAVNVLDAKGDIPYASAANTLAALNIGTIADVLTVNAAGDAPEWKAPASQVSDTAYAASWDTVATVAPSKNAVYDKVQTLMALTGANLAIGSDADGDMYYRASSVLARLAKSTANFKLFMNAGATAPEWAKGLKVGTFTRAMDAATGGVAYTGVGFKPSTIIFLSVLTDKASCVGFTDGTSTYSIANHGTSGNRYGVTDRVAYLTEDTGKIQEAALTSLDADGFTLAWTRTGETAGGSGYVYYLAIR